MALGKRLRAVLAGGAIALAAVGFGTLHSSLPVQALAAPGTCETIGTGGVLTTGTAPIAGAPLDCTIQTATNIIGAASGSIQVTLLNGASFGTPPVAAVNGVAAPGILAGSGCTFSNTGTQWTANCTGAGTGIPAGTNLTFTVVAPAAATGNVSANEVEQSTAITSPLNRTIVFNPPLSSGATTTAPAVTCSPSGTIASGSTTSCNISLAGAVPAGAISVSIAGPLPASFTSCTTVGTANPGAVCGVTPGNPITITCPAAGCVAGLLATVGVTSTGTGPLTFNFLVPNTFPAGSTTPFTGVAPVPPVIFGAATTTAPLETCSNPTPTIGTLASSSTTCTLTLTSPLPAGASIVKTVTGPTGVFAVTTAPAGTTFTPCTFTLAGGTVGTCTISGIGAGGVAVPAGFTGGNTITITCPPTTVAGCAGGSTVSFTLTGATAAGGLTQTFASGTGVPIAVTPPVVTFGSSGLTTSVNIGVACSSFNTSTNSLTYPFNLGGTAASLQTLSGTITFPVQANGQIGLPTNTPGALSILAPLGLVQQPSIGAIGPYNNGFLNGLPAVPCGAVVTDVNGGPDGNPLTVPDGTITYTVTGNNLAIITLNNTTVATVQCQGGTTPIEGCVGGIVSGTTSTTPVLPTTFPATVSPNPSNIIFVALNSGVSFALFGAQSPTVVLTATYNEDPTLGNLTASATTTIGFISPAYQIALAVGTPNIVAGAPGYISTTGSTTVGGSTTITATLFHFAGSYCVPLTNYPTGIQVSGTAVPFLICGTTNTLLNTTPGLATTPLFLAPGAEPGTITFTTSLGYFSTVTGTTTASPYAGQTVTVQCGSLPAQTPTLLTPLFSIGAGYSLTSCQSVTVTLLGGGSVGTATVIANYIGQLTGSTAQSSTTVNLTPTPASSSLTRGCNEVVINAGNGLTAAQVLALANPTSNVVSIWQFNNSLHAFQALYFNTTGAPTDISSVGGGSQSVFYCVSGTTGVTTGF